MIKIVDKGNRVIADIAKNHYLQMAPIVRRAITRHLPLRQREYILDRLETILAGTPQELLQLRNNYHRFCQRNRLNENRGMTSAFSYENFLQRKSYNAYDLSELLGINVCPYCNRQYTFTITESDDNITRPELDHFFCQELYPMLALSFYNLIPSCTICNSRLKGRQNFSLNTHLHPYLHGFEKDLIFNYATASAEAAIGLSDDIDVVINLQQTCSNQVCIQGNCDTFKIEKIYKKHKDVVREIVRKHYTTGGRYLQMLAHAIPDMNTSVAELYQLAFGNYYDAIDFDRRPLGKLTKDIFEGLRFELPE